MENIADALKMAAAVLIFVLALSISINAFGQARQTAQIILDAKDREYDYTYVEDNGTTQRIVGAESIVPSIYKAYKENYKIVFNTNKIADGLYKKKDRSGNYVSVFSIDLENEVLGSDSQREEFITAILHGADDVTKNKFQTNLGILLNSDGIYGKIKGNKFVEKLGIYYQEEVYGSSNTPDANKTEKRVITYADS